MPITPPGEVALPVNLLQTRFSSHVLFADGVEQASYSYFGGSVGEAKCGGQNRPALSLHPPPAGKSLADWWLKLPATAARLVTAIGIRDGAKSKGVGFAIEVNGRKVFEKTVQGCRLAAGGNQPGRVEEPAGGDHVPDRFTQGRPIRLGSLGRAPDRAAGQVSAAPQAIRGSVAWKRRVRPGGTLRSPL